MAVKRPVKFFKSVDSLYSGDFLNFGEIEAAKIAKNMIEEGGIQTSDFGHTGPSSNHYTLTLLFFTFISHVVLSWRHGHVTVHNT